jgi:hypothetical protein
MAGSIDRYLSLLRNLAAVFLWPLSFLIAILPSAAQEAIPLPRERPGFGTQDRSPTPSIDLDSLRHDHTHDSQYRREPSRCH